MPEQEVMSYLTGLAGLAVLWIVVLIATGKHPWALVVGEDGQPSTSKFQMLVWTAATVFAFLAIYQIQFSSGFGQDLPSTPTNLLIAMGISVATAVSAKSIAVGSQARSDAAAATAAAAGNPPPATPQSLSGIFAGDDGKPDLGKVQVVLWTVIAVGVFLSNVFALIHSPGSPHIDPQTKIATFPLGLPDISQTLMILMGLGHGAYIGKKIAES
ncbi:MAG: hypothetical protein ABSD43_08850 [Terracidiphilus sp.]